MVSEAKPSRGSRVKSPKLNKAISAKIAADEKQALEISLIDVRYSRIAAERHIFPEKSTRGKVTHDLKDIELLLIEGEGVQGGMLSFKLVVLGTDATEKDDPKPSFKVEIDVEGVLRQNLAECDDSLLNVETLSLVKQMYAVAITKAREVVMDLGYRTVRLRTGLARNIKPSDIELQKIPTSTVAP